MRCVHRRGEEISLETAAEMIFEADTEGNGQLALEDWLLTLRSLHDDELLNSETARPRSQSYNAAE